MELYICDFMKNKDCEHGCVYFSGTCAATTRPEFEMSMEDILMLPAPDFEKMHYALPDELRKKMVAFDWYWRKHMDSCRQVAEGDKV